MKNKLIKNYIILLLFFNMLEITFRLISDIRVFDLSYIRIFIGLNIASLFFSYLLSWLNKKVQKTGIVLISLIASIYAFVQVGFNNFIGVYASVNTSSQLGAVVDYLKDFFASFLFVYYLMFIPFILLVLYYLFLDKKIGINFAKRFPLKANKIKYEPGIRTIGTILSLVVAGFLYNITLNLDIFNSYLQMVSNKDLFHYPSVPSLAINQFGVLGFGALDIKSLFVDASQEFVYTSVETEEKDTNRYFDDTNWLQVIEEEQNSKRNNISNYLINQNITDYNDYSGMFEGKNLIVIMMESVNDIFINEDLYPNFYKMYSEGWNFTNNYSPRNSCSTGNNEFSGMTGLYTIQNNCTANVYRKNIYFEALFNLFNNKGYTTSSMHNYTEAYYYRATIHPNLGSGKYYGVEDLGISYSNEYKNWSSDEDFMRVAMDITLEDTTNPFMLWLTTVTSHQPYSQSSIEGDKYLDLTKDMNLPLDLRRYMSKLKILDDGLGVLLSSLEEAGILDDTVIVMYGDHYPYGLSKDTINKVLDYDLDEYEVERVPLVMYNPNMEANVIERYTSYINLTPTLANLFNLDYDPRLYMGTDLFSEDYLNIVTFSDGSWKNNLAYYDASKSRIKYYTDLEYSTDEIMNINNIVTTKMKISKDIIESNYFAYLYDGLNKINENNILASLDERNEE